MLSVGYLTGSLSSRAGGLSITMPATINALTRLGVDATVLGLHDDEFHMEDLTYESAQVTALSSIPFPGMRLSPEMDEALSLSKADILHLNGLWIYPSIAAMRWQRRTKRPLVISPHGMLDAWALSNSSFKKLIALSLYERRNLENASCIHALNEAELSAVRSLGLRNPVAVIPNGVDLPELDKPSLRPKLLGQETRKILLSLGRIHPKKGLIETVKAWGEVLKRSPTIAHQWVLVIAGWDDGGHLAEVRKEAIELEASNSILFVGPVFGEYKEGLFKSASAFILASHSEGLPMSVLEAWSYKLPVLMTRACNLPDGFTSGAARETTTEPRRLAEDLMNFLEEPHLAKMGIIGRELVSRKYTWTNAAKQFLDVYCWLIGRGARPECIR